ncbi:MAG: hypothetical protein ACKVHO_07885 [Verrucomicrobiia bacterium]|jgi:arylformamidase
MKSFWAFLFLASVSQAQNVTRDIRYSDPAHERHVLDVYSPANAKGLPVVFWIHGGGWVVGDKTNFSRR